MDSTIHLSRCSNHSTLHSTTENDDQDRRARSFNEFEVNLSEEVYRLVKVAQSTIMGTIIVFYKDTHGHTKWLMNFSK